MITIPCKLISYGCLGRLSWASISCFVNLCLGKSISVSVLPGHIQLTRIPVSLMAAFSSKVATKKEIFEGWTAQMDNGFSKHDSLKQNDNMLTWNCCKTSWYQSGLFIRWNIYLLQFLFVQFHFYFFHQLLVCEYIPITFLFSFGHLRIKYQ